jgi:hypothetical protein
VNKLTSQQRKAALLLIDEIKADPEYEATPELHDKVSQLEQGLRAQDQEDMAGQEKRIKAGEIQPKSGLRKAWDSVAETVSDIPGTAKSIGKQAAGTLAGAAQSVPGYVTAVEGIGDLGQRILPGFGNVWPTPGTHAKVMSEAPSPTTALVSGAAMTAPLATAGAAGRALFGAGNAIYSTGERAAERVLPGVLAPRLAGAALGQGALATTEAVGRRVPQMLTEGSAPPIDFKHEVVVPTVVGTVMAAPGAAQSTSVNPDARGGVGIKAQRYANDRSAGLHEKGVLPALEKRTSDQLSKTEQTSRRELDASVAEAKARSEEFLAGEGERGARVIESEKQYGQRMVSDRAAAQEQSFRQKFAKARGQSKDTFDAELKDIAEDPAVHDPETGKPALFDTQPVMDEVRSLVEQHAREDTAGTKATKSLLLTSKGEPVAGSAGEKHMALGSEFERVERELQSYLGPQASLADYRNAIQNFQKMAERGTPVQQYTYGKILGALREHVANVDPTGRLAKANQAYRQSASQRERLTDMVYRSGEENLPVAGTPEQRFDSPDESGRSFSVMPSEEIKGAKWFEKSGDPDAIRARHEQEMREAGYADELASVASARTNARLSLEQAQERVANEQALAEERAARYVDTERAGAQYAADERVSDAQAASDRVVASKEALEESRFPPAHRLAMMAAPGVYGLAHGGPYGLMFDALTLAGLGVASRQALRSRAAYHLPEGQAYREGMTPLLGIPDMGAGGRADLLDAAQKAAQEAERKRAEMVGKGKQVLQTMLK